MSDNRSIRVFVSSTFRDMVEERNALMTHAWPELRRFCRERQAELVEVDLRWGIAEEQSKRKETLKLCLDEIHSCRPFFIGMLGERYGWVPGDDAFTADLTEEQPWLRSLSGKSVTELEILHGVLNNPEVADRSFFYFRDPAYTESRGADFVSQNEASGSKQAALKALIRKTCAEERIPLRENYPDPQTLAEWVLDDLKAAVEARFPVTEVPDPLACEARDHEAFAETLRRTYIGRPEYFAQLDCHAAGEDGPLVLLGQSGSGKSALMANWIEHWRAAHPHDFVFQHYIGGTPDSADHRRLMGRLVAEIKRWAGDPDEVPRSRDDLLRDFPIWLAKARARAERQGHRCIIVLDALNQLEDRDHARLLGWLPPHPFSGPLRLVVSTLPVRPPADDPQKTVDNPLRTIAGLGWETLRVEPFTQDERRQMIAHYLARFGKKLESTRVERLATAPAAANPLYLRILLDELRVTGTHQQLDERLTEYLRAGDIPALLAQVLARYRRDYERDRPGLVGEALGLMWAARRGLSETEILRLLRPPDLPQLPRAIWVPLRAALEEGLVDRGGILNLAHEFLRSAVEAAFVSSRQRRDKLRLQLADDFEKQPVSARSCDELPWLLAQVGSFERLRACLLDIDRFLEIFERDRDELRQYWVDLHEERTMGAAYLASFENWSRRPRREETQISFGANQLAHFLHEAATYAETESLMRRSLAIVEQTYGPVHLNIAGCLNNLAWLLHSTNRFGEAEPLMRRALAIRELGLGLEHPEVAESLNNLAALLQATNRLSEAEPLFRRALAILEKSLGPEHPKVAPSLNNLATLLEAADRLSEAEPLYRRALEIDEQNFGLDHPRVATRMAGIGRVLKGTNRLSEAEPVFRGALEILEKSLGPEHPNVAAALNYLAELLQATNRFAEAELLYLRALKALENSLGSEHPSVATTLNNLAQLLEATNRRTEAEPLMRRALAISEKGLAPEHPNIALMLDNLAQLLQDAGRSDEAEPLMRRALVIWEKCLGPEHPNVATRLNNLVVALQAANRLAEAEPLMRRALAIWEMSLGPEDPTVAVALNNLARLLHQMDRASEAELPMSRQVQILFNWTRAAGQPHPNLENAVSNYGSLLLDMGLTREQVFARLRELAPEFFP